MSESDVDVVLITDFIEELNQNDPKKQSYKNKGIKEEENIYSKLKLAKLDI
ncbi:3948_t:CDS:2 [Funneliformis caledonium]|uniref:3948_t:CDS:1 n=1 Tax=Funneliformis caledonium TaxID=1117310 RepID=A0A9N9J221_9GLOM|nr:3948_t:CDS:2 [Funneliformis caledonium]